MNCLDHLKHFRWDTYGELIVRREDVSVSLCSVTFDILGEPTYMAEIELVLATTTLLGKLDFHNFTIRINDRRILKAMAEYSGFPKESFDTVFYHSLTKMDKIGS